MLNKYFLRGEKEREYASDTTFPIYYINGLCFLFRCQALSPNRYCTYIQEMLFGPRDGINWHTTLFFDHNRGQENSSAGPAIGGGNGSIYGDDRSRPIKLGEPEDDGDDWARTLELLKEGDSAG